MSHDTALCEMILSCQLLVGNWADLHANGLHLFNDVGRSGAITPGGEDFSLSLPRCRLAHREFRQGCLRY